VSQHLLHRIYLDYAATTPMRTEVIEAMQAAVADGNFNPSSPHAEGRRARTLLDDARDRVASALGASRNEITFTGSGTEADNLALCGVARAFGGKARHVLAGAIEHHAVLRALDDLREQGCRVTILPVDESGRVDPAEFAAAIQDDTVLASIMYANNEIGTVQPIAKLAEIAHERGVLFHTDAVQAPGWLPIDVQSLNVDLLSLSAHKFYGPKGVGMLYVRRGTPIAPAIPGGGQEFGRRSGTENVVGVVGAAAALNLATAEREKRATRIGPLRDRLEAGIVATVAGVRINAAAALRLPNIASVSFAAVEAEALLMRLDLEGVAVSAGSACTSGALEPSHVIAALGGAAERYATMRFSLGSPTTPGEIDRILSLLPPVVAALRRPAATPA
jgi:cysteine desulfurase